MKMTKGRTRQIYIAGPMRGKPKWNYKAFDEAASRLRAEGWLVHNPVEIGVDYGTPKELEASPARLRLLMDVELEIIKTRCDAIYLLRGWETSTGAREELRLALEQGLDVFLEPSPTTNLKRGRKD